MAWTPPTSEDLAKWPRPDEAVANLSGGQNVGLWRNWILDRLKSGLTIAVAHHFATNDVQRPAEQIVRVPRRIWNGALIGLSDYFWKMGEATFARPPLGLMDIETVERYHDIRIDPSTLSAAPQISPEPLSGEAEKRQISPLALATWVAEFIAINPHWTKKLVEDQVKIAFPGNKVARQKLRELLPHRPEGRPRKSDT